MQKIRMNEFIDFVFEGSWWVGVSVLMFHGLGAV